MQANPMLRITSLFLIAILLQACATNIQKYSEIDETEKTITVPTGSKGLKGDIKRLLAQDGWALSVYRGPDVTEGAAGDQVRLEHYDTFNTRYTLFVASSVYDYCMNFSPAISYDISLVDNSTGTEVMTMDGNGCESNVAQKFMDNLAGNKK